MSKTQQIIDRGQQVLIGNYARLPVAMERGQGSTLWDADGKQYIDLFAGFGGAILGHCHPDLISTATEQSHQLWHVGNTFWTQPQIELAERLNRHAFKGQAFFCHSGLESNEAACKLARIRGKDRNRWKIISLHKSFHGRSLAMISATGNPKTKAGFEPAVPGFIHVEGGDFDALKAAVDPETAGVIMEPIQGEGGINLYPPDYPAKVRELCDKEGLTLIFDEVWTGCGRTGKWFGYQWFESAGGGVIPDIMTLGKAIGGGLPVGVMFARPEVARHLVPGTHGCTLGANCISMAVARTILDVIDRDKLLSHTLALSDLAVSTLRADPRIAGKVKEIRGRGLMLGIELNQPPQNVVEKGLELGVIINLTAGKVIRLAPALNIPRDLFTRGLDLAIQAIAAA